MKSNIIVSSILAMTFTVIFMIVSTAASANSVVVIPLISTKKLGNVITVAKSGGDYTNPVEAINSIPTAGDNAPSFSNRYLIVIGPGVYPINTRQIAMRQWVSIQGAGEQATFITGAVSTTSWDSSSATIIGEDNAALSDLTIQNTGGSSHAMGIYIHNTSPVIENVTFTVPSTPGSTGVTINGSSTTKNNAMLSNITTSGYVGMSVSNTTKAIIRESTIEGTIWGLTLNGSTNAFQPRIINNKIHGGVSDQNGGKQCHGNYDENLGSIDC